MREVVNTLISSTTKETTLNPIVHNISNIDMCYDLSLDLRLHLGKDLRGSKGNISSGKA